MRSYGLRRREFITLLGGAAAGLPLAARAQPVGKVFRIGVLGYARSSGLEALFAELHRLGFNDGENLSVQWRFLDEDARAPQVLADELVRTMPDVLVVNGPEVGLKAAVEATKTIPIVTIAINFDPIARGYVASLGRPGGNVTGVFFRQTDLAQKQIELLTEAFPGKTRICALWDALSADQFSAAERAAKSLNVELRSLKLENPPYDFNAVFETLAGDDPQLLLVLSSPYFTPHQFRIAELAA
jgi:putative tryptophan/tyrosine transport system substrate-binding protein